MPRKPVVLFQWKQSAPYLVDRLEATRRAGVTPLEIVNVSDAATSYEWPFDPTASQTVAPIRPAAPATATRIGAAISRRGPG